MMRNGVYAHAVSLLNVSILKSIELFLFNASGGLSTEPISFVLKKGATRTRYLSRTYTIFALWLADCQFSFS